MTPGSGKTAGPPSKPVPISTPLAASPVERAGFLLAMGFLLMLYTRLHERYAPSLHLPAVFASGMVLAAVLSGGLFRTIKLRVTLFLLAFTVWFMACIPFAAWRGGSFALLTDRWGKSMLIFLALSCLVVTFEQTRRMLRWNAVCVALAAGLALFLFGSYQGGRLGLFAEGELANANQFAMVLVLALPLCWYWLANPVSNLLQKMPALAMAGVILVALVRTGSRAALLAVGLMLLIAFFQASNSGRVKMVIATFILVPLIVLLTPRQALLRYSTFFEAAEPEVSDEEVSMQISTMQSTTMRLKLQKEAVLMTLRYPVFGLGPGNFIVVRSEEKQRQGATGAEAWLQPHNTYTQISSEMGIPGILLFLGAVACCFTGMSQLKKAARARRDHPELAEVRLIANCLILQLSALCLLLVFGTNAYDFYFPAIAGQIVGVQLTAMQVVRRHLNAPAATPAPMPAQGLSQATPRRTPIARLTPRGTGA